jgi:hypothetical protein
MSAISVVLGTFFLLSSAQSFAGVGGGKWGWHQNPGNKVCGCQQHAKGAYSSCDEALRVCNAMFKEKNSLSPLDRKSR